MTDRTVIQGWILLPWEPEPTFRYVPDAQQLIYRLTRPVRRPLVTGETPAYVGIEAVDVAGHLYRCNDPEFEVMLYAVKGDSGRLQSVLDLAMFALDFVAWLMVPCSRCDSQVGGRS